jgi:hypothetical protein
MRLEDDTSLWAFLGAIRFLTNFWAWSMGDIAFLALVRYIGKGTAVPCPYIA